MICPYFGECGGCSTQHIPYEQQLEQKKNNLAKLINFDNIEVIYDEPFNYRNRMDFVFHPKGLGLRMKGDWKSIVDIKECPISNDKVNLLLKEVNNFFHHPDSFDIRKHKGTFKYAVIRAPTTGTSISFVLNDESTRLKEATETIQEFKTTADNIIVTRVPPKTDHSIGSDYFIVKGSDQLQESFLNKTFHFNVQGFFQNNTKMAIKMQEYVNNILKQEQTSNHHLLDLYGGVGTFGIVNADLFKSTIIVEEFAPAIETAKENIKLNNAKAEAHVLDAKNLKKLDLPSPLMVITDPPRSGMHPNTTKYLSIIKPDLIIYISCNPKQLAKDLHKFTNYEIHQAALFDLFPQTNHMETIITLKKNK